MTYTSDCCTAKATKPALVKTKDADGGLGHWTCSKCGKNCKVKRTNETSS